MNHRLSKVLTLFLSLTGLAYGQAYAPPRVTYWINTDGDFYDDPLDNCIEVINNNQADDDRDGYGNACDGDFNQSGLVTIADFATLRDCLNQRTEQNPCAVADLDGNYIVTAADYSRWLGMLNKVPGPSRPYKPPEECCPPW